MQQQKSYTDLFFAIMIKKLKLIRGSHRDAASGSVTHRLGGSRGDVAGENEMENSEKKEKEKRRSERGYEYVIVIIITHTLVCRGCCGMCCNVDRGYLDQPTP